MESTIRSTCVEVSNNAKNCDDFTLILDSYNIVSFINCSFLKSSTVVCFRFYFVEYDRAYKGGLHNQVHGNLKSIKKQAHVVMACFQIYL